VPISLDQVVVWVSSFFAALLILTFSFPLFVSTKPYSVRNATISLVCFSLNSVSFCSSFNSWNLPSPSNSRIPCNFDDSGFTARVIL
jgi:hypothetical protein